MTYSIGIDIGGTKIAGAVYDAAGKMQAQTSLPTPAAYGDFIDVCRVIVGQLERTAGKFDSLGVCAPFTDGATSNMQVLVGKDLRKDLEEIFACKIPFANDANCAALAEAMEGAGRGYQSVFGLILGTGVGGGFVLDGKIVAGANGMCGEIGHLPLPYYEASDGERVACGCGQTGCIEKLVAGAALARLHQAITGRAADAKQIAEQAAAGDKDAMLVLDRYYTIVAKAMTAILHTFDPDIIAVSGGLNALPGLYDEVTKRWKGYALSKNPKTKFVPAAFGSMAGLRGAALLGMSQPAL